MPTIDELRRSAAEWEARAKSALEKDREPYLRIAQLYRDLVAKLTRKQGSSHPE